MPPRPSATERRFVLTLGGVVCGFVTSAEGGDISAPVIHEPGGAFVRKRLGPPAPTPIDLSFDLSLDKVVYEWIAQAWAGNATPRGGSLIELDPNNQARAELTFENAVVAASTVPAMDAASKTPCVLNVRLVAAVTGRHAPSGPAVGVTAKPKKAWLPSNFRLELGDLDTKRVSKVEAFTVPTGEKGAVDFPDLRVELAETSSEKWTCLPGPRPEGRAREREARGSRYLPARAAAGARRSGAGLTDTSQSLLRADGAGGLRLRVG